MQKIYLLVLLPWLALAPLYGQHEALNRFIDDHKSDPKFTFAYLSKDLFEVVSRTSVEEKDWQQLHRFVRNVGSLRVLAADQITNGRELYREVRRLVPETEFDELMTIRAEETNVNLWTKDDGQAVTDLVLLVGAPDDFVLMCFTGALELSNVAELARLMNAEDARELTRAAQAAVVDFQISPNPSNGAFTLTYLDEKDAPAALTVADQNGRQVGALELADEVSQQVTLRELPAGLYWVQLKTRAGKVGVKQVQIVKN